MVIIHWGTCCGSTVGSMSELTAVGRKKARDHKLDGVYRSLRLDKNLNGLSRYQRGTLAELKLIGRDLYADIKRRGVILENGEVNPAVEAHRKNAHEQLYSLSVFTELNRTQQGPADIELSPAECDEIIAAGTRAESLSESAAVPQAPPAQDDSEAQGGIVTKRRTSL